MTQQRESRTFVAIHKSLIFFISLDASVSPKRKEKQLCSWVSEGFTRISRLAAVQLRDPRTNHRVFKFRIETIRFCRKIYRDLGFIVCRPSVCSRRMKSSSLRGTTLLCIARRLRCRILRIGTRKATTHATQSCCDSIRGASNTARLHNAIDKSIRDASFKMFLLLSDYPTSAKHPRRSLLRRIRGPRGTGG